MPDQPVDMHAEGFPESDEPHPMILVRRDDLVTVLREAEGFIGGKDNGAFARLAAAAGVS